MGGDEDKDLFGDSSSDGDTDTLIAAAKSQQPQPIARKKGGSAASSSSKKMKKKDDVPDADADDDEDGDDDDDDDDDDDAAGLFDSSSDDDDDDDGGRKGSRGKKGKKKLGKKRKVGASKKGRASFPSSGDGDETTAAKKDTRSMKERMEALARKRAERGGEAAAGGSGREPRKKRSKSDGEKKKKAGGEEGDGYRSGDSYESANSATYVRTKEDDDFIDDDDDDDDAKKELYAEQHFDDERPDGYDSDEEEDRKKKRSSTGGKKSSSSGGGMAGLDKISLSDDEEGGGGGVVNATNALKAAVRGMQKTKKKAPGLAEIEEEGSAFLRRMTEAADADDKSIAAKRPALRKLAMLQEVTDMLVRKNPEGKDGPSMVRVLLDNDLLAVCKRWVQPLPDGTLGNITLRRRLMEVISTMTGEGVGITSSDLKRSGFGRVVMALYQHKSETPEMKKVLKGMIEQWSRPIFQKSGNLRDLEGAQAARGGFNDPGSLVGMARARHLETRREEEERLRRRPASGSSSGERSPAAAAAVASSSSSSAGRGRNEDDLERIISRGGDAAARDIGNNRVRIPFSKGFQYSVRPESRRGNVSDGRNLVVGKKAAVGGGSVVDERRVELSKRMDAKSKKVNKATHRSANISIEGRAVK